MGVLSHIKHLLFLSCWYEPTPGSVNRQMVSLMTTCLPDDAPGIHLMTAVIHLMPHHCDRLVEINWTTSNTQQHVYRSLPCVDTLCTESFRSLERSKVYITEHNSPIPCMGPEEGRLVCRRLVFNSGWQPLAARTDVQGFFLHTFLVNKN